MKILLVQPPLKSGTMELSELYLDEPLALETIATTVYQHDVKILDMRVDPSLEQELSDFQPDVVATTSYTPEVYRAIKVLEKAKEYNSNIFTVIGGHHATLMPQDFYKSSVDAIVIGEGEITFRELINAYESGMDLEKVNGLALPKNGKLIFTPPRELISNLNETPLPKRELTERYRDKYFRLSWRPLASLMTSRGCAFRCNFCSVWKHEHGKYRVRSPERVVAELLTMKEKYISIHDDDFLQAPKRAEKICDLIKEKGIQKKYKILARADSVIRCAKIIPRWKEIGLEVVTLGLESFRDEELKALNKCATVGQNETAIKILHDNGIVITAQFIVNPNYTKEDFDALAEYVIKMKFRDPLFSILTPLPATDLYSQTKDQLLTHNYEMFDLVHSILPTKLPRKEFYQYYADLFRKCYSNSNHKEDSDPFRKKIVQQIYSYLLNAYEVQQ